MDKYQGSKPGYINEIKALVIPDPIAKVFFTAPYVVILIAFILYMFGGRKGIFFCILLSYTCISIYLLTIGITLLIASTYNKKLSTKVIGVLFVILTALPVMFLSNYYKNLPNIINSEYSYYEGKLTSFIIPSRHATHTHLQIDNNSFEMKFKPSEKRLPTEGDICRVEYLPNTKFVMNIYSIH